jgi:hypothetical protein
MMAGTLVLMVIFTPIRVSSKSNESINRGHHANCVSYHKNKA